MKKLLTIIMILALVLTLAAGCGNNNNASDTAEESLRGSAGLALDGIDIGNATLDDIDSFDAEVSLRAGSSWSIDDFESIVD